MKRLTGFTLIEILIALFILAIVGAMIATGLQSAIRSQNRISKKAERLATLQSAIIILERDIAQIINRPIIDINGASLPAVFVRYPNDKLTLEFTHAGLINPFAAQNRTTLQRVSYAWDGQALIRTSWQALDRVQATPMDTQVLLPGVKSFGIRFMDNNHQLFVPGETPLDQPFTMPLAIEVNLDVDGIGSVTRITPLPGSP